MLTTSYYAATRNDDAGFPAIKDDLRVDVAIVGGGFSGVSAAQRFGHHAERAESARHSFAYASH